MKFRTDFVTNSSSTCFVFKEKEITKHEPEIVRSITQQYKDFVRSDLEKIEKELLTLSEYGRQDADVVKDIYDCFYKDILQIAVYGYEEYRSSQHQKMDDETIAKMIRERKITNEAIDRLSAIVALQLYFDYGFYIDDHGHINSCYDIFSREMIDDDIPEMVFDNSYWNKQNIIMNEFVSNYLDEIILRRLHKFIGLNCGEILEIIIGKAYVFNQYYDNEYTYLAENLSKLHDCVFVNTL